MAGEEGCCACKAGKRKCREDCFLKQFYPWAMRHDYGKAHRVFGGPEAISKLIRKTTPDRYAIAANAILEEAKLRDDDPAVGAWEQIQQLEARVLALERQVAVLTVLDCTQLFEKRLIVEDMEGPLFIVTARRDESLTLLPNLEGQQVFHLEDPEAEIEPTNKGLTLFGGDPLVLHGWIPYKDNHKLLVRDIIKIRRGGMTNEQPPPLDFIHEGID